MAVLPYPPPVSRPRPFSRFARSSPKSLKVWTQAEGHGFKEDDPVMKHQAFRTIALMLGVMLAAAPAVQAGTITYGELVRTAGADGQLRPASEVRLRLAAQGPAAAQSGAVSSQEQQASGQQTSTPSGSSNVPAPAASDPTLSQSGSRVETIDIGDVTGTVCDCGEIPPALKIPVGGFPWWTLAGIPLVCVSGICAGGDDDTIIPPTTPTPPSNPPSVPTPEPISLLLFGSGLLAVGARRRRARRQLEGVSLSATTEEV